MNTESIITREDCLKILNRFSTEKYQFDSFTVVPFGNEPLGFLAEHAKLLITVNQNANDKKQQNVLQFFVKTVPSDTIDAHKDYVLNIGVFLKEALLYKTILSKLLNLASEPFAPRCYFVNTGSSIVLEDLALKGYTVVKEKSKTLDFAHCKCLTETLARFHVSSIIYEEQNTLANKPYRIYDYYKDMLFETTFSWEEGNARCDWLKITLETLFVLCKKMDEFKDRDCTAPLNQLVEKTKEYIAPSKKYRNVLNQGDLWSNNIMFTYNKNNEPEKCVIVDFQMARYVPPSYDFLTFLYLTTTKEFHEKYFSSLVDIYLNVFTAELKRHNINADNILSKQEFLESCEYYKPVALLEAAMFGTIVYLNSDFSKDMLADDDKFNDFMRRNRSKLVSKLFDEDAVYRERVGNVLKQLMNCIL